MNLVSEYNKFYECNKNNIKYSKKAMKTIKEMVEENDIPRIEDRIIEIQGGKANSIKRIWTDFMNFLINKGYNVSTSFQEFYEDDELYAEYLKLIQKPIRCSEVIDKLHISERTIKRMNAELTYGRKIYGVEVKTDVVRSKGKENTKDNEFQASVHPIGLMLNLTEVYTLIVGLLDEHNAFPNQGYGQPFLEMAQKIYNQLTSYGQEIIDEALIRNGQYPNLKSNNKSVYQTETYSLSQSDGNKLLYVFKSGQKIYLTINHGGKTISDDFYVRIRMNRKEYELKTDDKTYIVKDEDIIMIGKIKDYK